MPLDSETQDRVTEFWGHVAPYYENDPGNTAAEGTEIYQRWVKLIERALPAPPSQLLDVCTGTGFAALIAASLGHRVKAIDLAPNMLQIGRAAAHARGVDIAFAIGDAVEPPFVHGSFDVIVSRHALWTTRDAHAAITRWYNLLSPGGRVVVLDCFHSWGESGSENEKYFYSYYTPEVRAQLPFLDIQDESPLVESFRNAGFADFHFEVLPEEFGSTGLRPYLFIAHRIN